tara:strand:- start:115 stop:585 length:471 start_codon:yes stop_codon:yes gene_type:complete
MKNKKVRLEKILDWSTKVPTVRKVFNYMLENPHITQRIFSNKLNIQGHIGLYINQLRNIGADITSTKHKKGGITFYSLRNKLELNKKLNTQPSLYSKSNGAQFKVLNSDTETHIEVPVYYWKDDKSVIRIDQELMSDDFNKKMYQLTKKHDEKSGS